MPISVAVDCYLVEFHRRVVVGLPLIYIYTVTGVVHIGIVTLLFPGDGVIPTRYVDAIAYVTVDSRLPRSLLLITTVILHLLLRDPTVLYTFGDRYVDYIR